MGCCFSEPPPDDDVRQPSAEERRRLQAEAAERRLNQASSRGIANPESVRRRQEKANALDALETSAGGQGNAGLRWTVSP